MPNRWKELIQTLKAISILFMMRSYQVTLAIDINVSL
jgi:hypothetical protein